MKKILLLLCLALLIGCQSVVLEPLHREHYFENYGAVHDDTMAYLYQIASLMLEDNKIDVVGACLKNDYPNQDFKPYIEVSILSTTVDLDRYLNTLYEEIGLTYPVTFNITTLDKDKIYTGYIDRVLDDKIWVKSHYETKYSSEWNVIALDVSEFDLGFKENMIVEYTVKDKSLEVRNIEIVGEVNDTELQVLRSLNMPMNRLSLQEIVIINELMQYQFSIFEIPYDELRVFHDEFLLYGKQMNDLVLPIPIRYPSSEPLYGRSLVGMNLDEMVGYLDENNFIGGYYYERIDELKLQDSILSVSEVISGSDDEKIVFAIKKSVIEEGESTLEVYILLRYVFKEVDGMTKIYVRKESYGYSSYDQASAKDRFESMYNYFNPEFNMEIYLNNPLYYHK